MVIYVKGFEFSVRKAAPKLGFTMDDFPIFDAMDSFRERVSREAYLRIDLGHRVNDEGAVVKGKDPLFIMVVDDDYDLQELKNRPLPTLHPDLKWAMPTLDGPFIYKPSH